MKTDRGINPQEYLSLNNNHDRLSFLVKLAALAPSSHNMQPWKFQIKDTSIKILADPSRKLIVADPDGREFAITLGTLVESLKMASDCYGLAYQFKIMEDFDELVAQFDYQNLNASKVDEIYLDAMVNRHNSRLPFESYSLPDNFLKSLSSLVEEGVNLHIISDSEIKDTLKPIVLDSIKEAFQDKNFRKELYPWLKPSIGRHEDGLVGRNLGMPFLVSLIFPSMTRFFDISDLQVKIHSRMLNNVPTFCILSSNNDSKADWLKVGMSFLKIAVEAEKNNISIGVMQGGIESPKHRAKIRQILGTDQKLQMFFRLGLCNQIHHHSPRRPLEKFLKQ